MSSIVTQMITILTSGLTTMATNIGSALNNFITNMFVTVSGTGDSATYTLTTFGAVVLAFGGIALAFSLSKWVLSFITSNV